MPPEDRADVALLENESMRARQRPGAVLLLWAWQAACGLLVAWPVAAGVDAVWGQHPEGDGALWEPGGFALAHFVEDGAAFRTTGAALFVAVVALGAVTSLVPLGGLLASIGYATRGREAPPLGAMLVRGARAFPTFVTLFVAASALEGGILVGARALAHGTSHHLAAQHGKAFADQAGVAAGLVVACAAAVVVVVQDLARAAAIRYRATALRALRVAVATLARTPARLVVSWAWRTAARVGPVTIGALVANHIGGRAGAPLVGLLLVHQLVLVACASLRASWLARALRAVDRAALDAPH